MSVRTALFPVGGLGTRFLPATKAIPKEMLPVLDKPLIQYAVEEARDAGIERFIFVTGKGKTAIDNHFDRAFEVEQTLIARGDTPALDTLSIKGIAPGSFIFIRQPTPLGLGHAIWCARHVLDEPFAVLLADDLILPKSTNAPSEIAHLIKAYTQRGGQWISAQEVPKEEVSKYGIIAPDPEDKKGQRVRHVVEKPSRDEAPGATAIIGRYVLDPKVLTCLDSRVRNTAPQNAREIQITDTLCELIPSLPLYAHSLQGERFDCGSLKGMLRATLHLAARRQDLAEFFKKEVETCVLQ